MVLVHHVNLLYVARVPMEILLTCVLLAERIGPSAVEVDGVHQHGDV